MERRTGAIKKTVVRNIEIPTKRSESQRNVVHNHSDPSVGRKPLETTVGKSIRRSAPLPTNMLEHGLKYKVPELHTTDRMKEQIEKLQAVKVARDEMLSPRSRAIVNHEITKKLNFPPDKPIYKNLVPINVNDSILTTPEHKKPFRKKYVAKSNKDPVPELADFLAPISPLKRAVHIEDKPLIQMRPKNNFYKSIYELHVNFHPDC